MYIRSLEKFADPNYHIPGSDDPHGFELLVRDCASIKFGQDFHLYGRSGQTQYGIDIFSDDWTLLIQCKAYSETMKNHKSFQEDIKAKFAEAKAHFQREGKPFFHCFILATTLKRDALSQEIVKELNEQEPDIKISVWFIDDLRTCINRYRIHNDGDTYADGFEETLFLHKNRPGCESVNLKNLFVPQEYCELSIGNGFGKTRDDLEDRIQNFCSDDKDKMLIIEGDAGSGKSTLAAMLCFEERAHSHQIMDTVPSRSNPLPLSFSLLAGRPLLTIRLRDLNDTENLEFRLGKSILSHLNIRDKKELAELFPRAVLLLDGLDELCVMLKEKVRDCENMLVQLIGWLPRDYKLIMTSRLKYIHVEKLSRTLSFSLIVLQHFSPQKRKEWMDKYKALFPKDNGAVNDEVARYIRSMGKNSVSNLCDTPMMLYLLIGSKAKFELTKNKWTLYNYVFSDAVINTPYAEQWRSESGTIYPLGPNIGGLLYWITEEIAYKMYCANGLISDQDGVIRTGDGQFLITEQGMTETITKLLVNPTFQGALTAGGVTDHETQISILKRSHALCCYWRSDSVIAQVEFYHNNIRDFFLCEKIRRVFNEFYQENGSDEEKTDRIAQHLISLFKFGDINETVCHFLQEYARDVVSDQRKNRKEFPLLEKEHPLLPLLYQKLLMKGILYDGLNMKDHVDAIKNILQNTALVYHSIYEPFLNEGEKIRWWNDVEAVNHSDIINYIFCQLVKKIGYRSDLQKADLHRADLHGADLRGADLSGTDLNRIDLHGAKMQEVQLHRANLYKADLRGAILKGANLNEVNLGKAYLNRADLNEADLRNAEFRGTDLRGTILPDGFRSDNQKEQIGHLKSLNISGLKIQQEKRTIDRTHNSISSCAAGQQIATNLAKKKRAGKGKRRQ